MQDNPTTFIDISSQTTPTQLNELHTANTTRPPKVPITSLRTAQRYFQGRMDGLDVAVKESIYDGLRNNNKIEPIVVFGSAEEPVVVDGHHRLAALRGWFHDKPNKTTNVVWVDGGIGCRQIRSKAGHSCRHRVINDVHHLGNCRRFQYMGC